MPDRGNDRVANQLAAVALAITDRVRDATEDAAGRGAAAPAALVTLHQFLDGRTMDDLRRATGLSPSGAVRLVDRLEADGLVARRAGSDARSVALGLTPTGRRAARRIEQARLRAVGPLTDALSAAEVATLERLVAKMIAAEVAERLTGDTALGEGDDGWLCRLCDAAACGRPDGHCPAVRAATARLDER